MSKVWFAPNAEAELLKKWGHQRRSATKADPLKADIAIDEVSDLRKLVVRREHCKAISHNKFIVLIPPNSKAASVWTGSTNLTQSGIFGQSNVAHIVNDENIAEQYLAYWKSLAADMHYEDLMDWNASCVDEDALPAPPREADGFTGMQESISLVTSP